jgi:hypothetical protein
LTRKSSATWRSLKQIADGLRPKKRERQRKRGEWMPLRKSSKH